MYKLRHHLILTEAVAELQSSGKLPEELFKSLRKLVSELKDTPEGMKLDYLLSSFRRVGKFYYPAEKSVTLELDEVRDSIHQKIFREVAPERAKINIAEKELLTAIPKSLKISSAKDMNHTTIIEGKSGWKNFDFTVKIKDNSKRKVTIETVHLTPTDVEIPDDFLETFAERACSQYFDEAPAACTVYLFGDYEPGKEKIKDLEGDVRFFNRFYIDWNEVKQNIKEYSDETNPKELKKEVLEYLRDCGCICVDKGERVSCLCEDYPTSLAIEDLLDIFEDVYAELREEEYKEFYIKEDRERVAIQGHSIGCDCTAEYAYPHGGGYWYYVKCKCEREYEKTPEDIAKSYKEIYNLLEELQQIR